MTHLSGTVLNKSNPKVTLLPASPSILPVTRGCGTFAALPVVHY